MIDGGEKEEKRRVRMMKKGGEKERMKEEGKEGGEKEVKSNS